MSSYATPAQLAQYSLNATALGGVNPISSTDQQAELDSASTEIDGYLASQYLLPLLTWGTDLTVHVCNIAAYRLMGRRGYKAGGADQGFKDRYDEAIRWATKIAQGTISPPTIKDSTPAGSGEGAPGVMTGLAGSTVGGCVTPSVQLGGPSPYPYIGTSTGKRGW